MKLIEQETVTNIYDKKIRIELTLGELVHLFVNCGDTNSRKVKEHIDTYYSEHSELGYKISNEELNSKLYKDLEEIHYKYFGKGE